MFPTQPKGENVHISNPELKTISILKNSMIEKSFLVALFHGNKSIPQMDRHGSFGCTLTSEWVVIE